MFPDKTPIQLGVLTHKSNHKQSVLDHKQSFTCIFVNSLATTLARASGWFNPSEGVHTSLIRSLSFLSENSGSEREYKTLFSAQRSSKKDVI